MRKFVQASENRMGKQALEFAANQSRDEREALAAIVRIALRYGSPSYPRIQEALSAIDRLAALQQPAVSEGRPNGDKP